MEPKVDTVDDLRGSSLFLFLDVPLGRVQGEVPIALLILDVPRDGRLGEGGEAVELEVLGDGGLVPGWMAANEVDDHDLLTEGRMGALLGAGLAPGGGGGGGGGGGRGGAGMNGIEGWLGLDEPAGLVVQGKQGGVGRTAVVGHDPDGEGGDRVSWVVRMTGRVGQDLS